MKIKYLAKLTFIAVALAAIPAYCNANILNNPGFEDGTTDWLNRGCSIEAVPSPVHSGSASARAYDRTLTWNGIQQDVLGEMTVGETYTISGWARIAGASSDNVVLKVQKADDEGVQYEYVASGTVTDTGWLYLSGNYTLSVNGTLTQLRIYLAGPAPGVDLYVDDTSAYLYQTGVITANGHANTNTRHQMIEGFGAAGAWYDNLLVNHPDKNTLYNLLFGQLGLDIYRVRNKYDLDGAADYMSNSEEIIAAAQASLGWPIKVLMSSWSPPAYLKSNDSTSGGGTLKKDVSGDYMYTEFAQWWADSLTEWSSYGITAEYISIQNEPEWEATWDSCLFGGTETDTLAGYNLAFEAVWQKLDTQMGASMPKMLAGESVGIPGSYKYLNNLIDTDHAYGYAHHLYGIGSGDNPDNYITAMTDFAEDFGSKPLFQTEYQKPTLAWPDQLNLAMLLHNSLIFEQVTAYLYWDLFWGNADVNAKGLINLTPTTYAINPDYYGFKHFSAFIHSGWQRIDTWSDNADLRISAYISPNDHQLTVVLINTNDTETVNADLSFNGFSLADGDVYRTSISENCVNVGNYNTPGVIQMPPSSVVTLSLLSDADFDPPAVPAQLTAVPGNETVALQWDDNTEPDLAGYNIYRSGTPQTGYTKLNSSLLTTSQYDDNDVTNYTSYFYVVTAVDTSSNESENSNLAAAAPNNTELTQLTSADFESGFGDWVNISVLDTHDWSLNSGGTSTGNTGPDGGADGSQWYVYLECSYGGASSAGDTAILLGPPIGGFNRDMTFDYHMFGAEIGTLNVDVMDDQGTWHEAVWTLSGMQQTSGSDLYRQAAVNLEEYTGIIQIRFRAVAAGGIRGDMAVDNIEVKGNTVYGDLNADNIVNINDLSEFMGYWLTQDCIELDLNEDCLINLNEFAELAKNWQMQF